MKKILALLLALVMALSLCGCENKKSKAEIVGNALNGTVWGHNEEISGATLTFTHNFYDSADSDGGKAALQIMGHITKTGEDMILENMQGTFSVDAGDVNKIYVTYNADVDEDGTISAANKPQNMTFEYVLEGEDITELTVVAESGAKSSYYKLNLD